MVIPYIGPNETMQLTLGVRSQPMQHESIYAWAGTPWSVEFEKILTGNYNEDDIRQPKESNLLSAYDLCYIHALAQEMRDSVGGQQRKPHNSRNYCLDRTYDLAENNVNVARAIGLTMGGIINGLRLRNNYAALEACGYDWRNGDEGPLADYNNMLRQGMPTPGYIVATAFGRDDEYEFYQEHFRRSPQVANPSPNRHDFTSYQSGDPNEMHGYEAPSGSNYIGRAVKTLDYAIEFENDPEIANAPAQIISVKSTIDGSMLNRASFKPTYLQLGTKRVELEGKHDLAVALDMRPEINAVANLDFHYNPSTGEALWQLESLDPMTMEPVEYAGNGILPVNTDGVSGIGYLGYSIDLKPNVPDGAQIAASASIVFDDNDSIDTPKWVNITDFTLPTASIVDVQTDDNQTFNFVIDSSDTGSGVWYCDLYIRYRDGADWIPVQTKIETSEFTYVAPHTVEGADFLVLATDRAGNLQNGTALDALMGDADGNGVVDASDVVLTRRYFTGEASDINFVNADVTLDGKIDAQDAAAIRNIYLTDETKNQVIIKRIRKQ